MWFKRIVKDGAVYYQYSDGRRLKVPTVEWCVQRLKTLLTEARQDQQHPAVSSFWYARSAALTAGDECSRQWALETFMNLDRAWSKVW